MNRLEGIKAVLFDFDDTLGDREIYAYQCYRALLKEMTNMPDGVEFEAILQDVMLWDERGNVNKRHVVGMLKKKYDIEIAYEVFMKYWVENLWKYCVPFEDSRSTLEYLSGKYKLGIITNGPSDGQRMKIRHAGLDGFFEADHLIVSGDYDYAKPDPRLFLSACERLGVKPEEAVYVGDIYANDVLGAYRAGLTPIWIWTAGHRPASEDVIVIRSIGELKRFL